MSDLINIPEFVLEFMTKYNSLINKIGSRYLIPNRYNIDDIKQYISERIMHILSNRTENSADNDIKNPDKYFKSCINFYCIEYQRMHGYIFELPKRPRKHCEEDEKYIRSFGFKYLDDMTTDEYNSLLVEDDRKDDKTNTIVWKTLLSILSNEEADVLDCIFNKKLTWLETSQYLGVHQSTCWFRKNRAIEKIYNAFDNIKGETINGSIRKFLRADPGILDDFRAI